jgi:hypothetical protein
VGVVLLLAYFAGNGSPEIRQAKTAVEAVLRDARSARFEGMSFKAGEGCVYGSVNGKNTFGGYTGRRSFIYDVDSKEIDIGDSNLRYLAITNTCLRKALE